MQPRLSARERRTGRLELPRRIKKVTLAIAEDQILRLDRLTIDIRAATGAVITRGEAVRAILDAVPSAEIDVTGVRSESDLRSAIASRLSRVAQDSR
jgi:hypothetical protein